jgi:hypothetical protein
MGAMQGNQRGGGGERIQRGKPEGEARIGNLRRESGRGAWRGGAREGGAMREDPEEEARNEETRNRGWKKGEGEEERRKRLEDIKI